MVMTYKPTPGGCDNPLLRYRNIPCLCGSNKKTKKCCGQHRYIKIEAAHKINNWLISKGLIPKHPNKPLALDNKPNEITNCVREE